MGFHEVRFPTDISYDSRGGPGYMTDIVVLPDSGAEQRTSRWSRARHRYDAAYGIKTLPQLDTVRAFFHARMGSAFGFRYKDWDDFTTRTDGRSAPSTVDASLGTGDASKVAFQLVKTYTSGGVSRTRTIQKPVAGTVLAALDGTPTTLFAVDTTTGIVTFNSAPGSGVAVTAGCEFDVPVRFGEDVDKAMMVSRDTFDTGGVDSIELVELLDERAVADEFWAGGSKHVTLAVALYAMSVLEARVWTFVTGVGFTDVLLPNPGSLAPGGIYFFVRNSGAQVLNIKDQTLAVVKTLATTVTATIYVGVDSSGNRYWSVQ